MAKEQAINAREVLDTEQFAEMYRLVSQRQAIMEEIKVAENLKKELSTKIEDMVMETGYGSLIVGEFAPKIIPMERKTITAGNLVPLLTKMQDEDGMVVDWRRVSAAAKGFDGKVLVKAGVPVDVIEEATSTAHSTTFRVDMLEAPTDQGKL